MRFLPELPLRFTRPIELLLVLDQKMWAPSTATPVGPSAPVTKFCCAPAPSRSARPMGCAVVAPVDVLAVDGDALGVGGAGDEVVVDGGAVEVGAPDRSVRVVRPVDVLAVDRDPESWTVGGDEALICAGPVEVRAADRRAAEVGPVDVLAVDGDAARALRGDERLVGEGAVELGAPDRIGAEVAPVDGGNRVRRQRQARCYARAPAGPLACAAAVGFGSNGRCGDPMRAAGFAPAPLLIRRPHYLTLSLSDLVVALAPLGVTLSFTFAVILRFFFLAFLIALR